MKPIRRTRAIAVALLLAVLLTACPDDKLKQVADGLDKTVAALSAAQKTVISANTPSVPGGPKLLSDEATIKIGEALININEAVIRGAETAETIAKLDTASREQLINILKPIIKTVEDLLLSPNITGIQNESTRTSIRIAIASVQTLLNEIQLSIALSK